MSVLAALLLFVAAFLTLYLMFPETFDQMFGAKLRGDSCLQLGGPNTGRLRLMRLLH